MTENSSSDSAMSFDSDDPEYKYIPGIVTLPLNYHEECENVETSTIVACRSRESRQLNKYGLKTIRKRRSKKIFVRNYSKDQITKKSFSKRTSFDYASWTLNYTVNLCLFFVSLGAYVDKTVQHSCYKMFLKLNVLKRSTDALRCDECNLVDVRFEAATKSILACLRFLQALFSRLFQKEFEIKFFYKVGDTTSKNHCIKK